MRRFGGMRGVHVLLLGGKQFLEPLAHHTIHGPLGTAAEFFNRSCLRCVVDHVFGEVDRTIGQSFNCVGDLAEILGVSNFVGMRAGGLQ